MFWDKTRTAIMRISVIVLEMYKDSFIRKVWILKLNKMDKKAFNV